jgi:toxin FitB
VARSLLFPTLRAGSVSRERRVTHGKKSKVILLDSNVVIYLRNPNTSGLIIEKLNNQSLHTCNVIVAEVLGFSKLSEEDEKYFQAFFDSLRNHPFDKHVTDKTIEIRRSYSVQLPDAIIAATAVVNDLTLWTHNTSDYQRVRGLRLFDPLAEVK